MGPIDANREVTLALFQEGQEGARLDKRRSQRAREREIEQKADAVHKNAQAQKEQLDRGSGWLSVVGVALTAAAAVLTGGLALVAAGIGAATTIAAQQRQQNGLEEAAELREEAANQELTALEEQGRAEELLTDYREKRESLRELIQQSLAAERELGRAAQGRGEA